MNEMYLGELTSTGQLLISRFQQLPGGNSVNGCGSAPPRSASMANVGNVDPTRNATIVSAAIAEVNPLDRTENWSRCMPCSFFLTGIERDSASHMPVKPLRQYQ